MCVITGNVLRGKKKGSKISPYKYRDGFFRVSLKSNLAIDAILVKSEFDLVQWLKCGYGVRMSGIGVAPSIYSLKSLIISSS